MDRLVVQAMAPPGSPARWSPGDPAFGPAGFSVGGVVSDLVEDQAYWMPPLTDADAHALIRTPRTLQPASSAIRAPTL